MGAMMGGCELFSPDVLPLLTMLPAVGLIMGFLFGGFNIMRYGAGTTGPMRLLGQYMLGSGATFGYVSHFLLCRRHILIDGKIFHVNR